MNRRPAPGPPTVPPYRPPAYLRSGHVNTCLGGRLRRVEPLAVRRTRLELPDGDFLDLDALGPHRPDQPRVVIVHGLEGDGQRAYVVGMARALGAGGWAPYALNLRGCSGEPNRLPRTYHSGATEDLNAVVRHLAGERDTPLVLVGFSLGGNLVLKFLGEAGRGRWDAPPCLKAGVGISVPVDLADAAARLRRLDGTAYVAYFLRKLKGKVEAKALQFPNTVQTASMQGVRTLSDFDDAFTAPLNGFRDAADYYAQASSKPFLKDIRVPALLLNALDDPFLGPECYPAVPYASPLVTEYPAWGGHVGFLEEGLGGETYAERRVRAFLKAAGATG